MAIDQEGLGKSQKDHGRKKQKEPDSPFPFFDSILVRGISKNQAEAKPNGRMESTQKNFGSLPLINLRWFRAR
jgi:hypothetical protein